MNGMQVESQVNSYYTRYGVFRRHFTFTVVQVEATKLFRIRSKCRVLRCSRIVVLKSARAQWRVFGHVVPSSQSDAPNLILFAHSKSARAATREHSIDPPQKNTHAFQNFGKGE